MPAGAHLWLVCYDIAEPGRLQRVARHMERRGIRLQYSVFAVVSDRLGIAMLRRELEERIDCRHDDVRLYPVSSTGRAAVIGAHLVPPDLLPHHEAFAQLRLPLPDRHDDPVGAARSGRVHTGSASPRIPGATLELLRERVRW